MFISFQARRDHYKDKDMSDKVTVEFDFQDGKGPQRFFFWAKDADCRQRPENFLKYRSFENSNFYFYFPF